jgi:fructokinase
MRGMRIGIDLGGTKMAGVVLDDEGRTVADARVPTPRDDYDATLRAVADLVERLERAAADECCVGIGIPGALSPATGLVKNANSVWLNGRALGVDLERVLARPVRLANDANCFALSEAVDGAGVGEAVVFGVILGTGTGGGIVIRGQAVVGPNAIAGEWGHNPMPWPRDDEWPGPPCYCGRTGCIETFLSGPGLERDHSVHTGQSLGGREIVRAARAGDAAADATLARYEDRLARGLASVVNVLDPDVIVLGGGLSAIERLYARVPALWSAYVFSDVVATRLAPPRFGDASGVRGAAWLWPRA